MISGAVLIIGQSTNMRRLIKPRVSGQVSRIVECQSGEALAAYAVSRLDWVLIDLSTGAPDGLTLVRQIVEVFPGAKVTVVADC